MYFRQWTLAEYREAAKSHYWNLAMSFLRFNPWCWFFKNYEKKILEATKTVLSKQEVEALDYQCNHIDGINRYHKGRFHTIFVDRRRLPPLSDVEEEVPLATIKIKQGQQKMTVIVTVASGNLYSISFKPGKFKEKEPFEIIDIKRGGKPSRTAQSIDRWAHGQDPETRD